MARADHLDEQPSGALAALREGHRRELLELLASAPEGLTQEELQAETRLSRSSVSLLLKGLEPVLESRRAAARASGRPPRVYGIANRLGIVVGVDIGLTRVYASVAALDGTPLDHEPIELQPEDEPRNDPERTLDAAAALVDRLLDAHGRTREEIAAVGVSLPGPVDRASGRMLDGMFTRWHAFDIRDELRRRLGVDVPVSLDKDANAALLAERRWGAAHGERDVLYVEWTSAIGTSVLINGRLWRGSFAVAGELGHVRLPLTEDERSALEVDANPPGTCERCGQDLCLQQLVGGLRLATLLEVDSPEEGIALADADPRARLIGETAAGLLGRGVGTYVTLVDPRLILVGGGLLTELAPFLEAPLLAGLDETAFPVAGAGRMVRSGKLGSRASISGALATALEEGLLSYLMAATGG